MKLFEHPITLLAIGGAQAGTGIWVILMKAITVGTLIFGFIAAFCGALTGVVGVYILARKWKNGTLFEKLNNKE